MKEQNIGYRLGATALMLLVPLVLLVYLYVSKLTEELNFSRDEIFGLELLQEINDIRQASLFKPHVEIAPLEWSEINKLIERKLDNLRIQLKTHQLEIDSSNNIAANGLRYIFSENEAENSQLQERILAYTTHVGLIVGNEYNLLVDPDQIVNSASQLLIRYIHFFPQTLMETYNNLLLTLGNENSVNAREEIAKRLEELAELKNQNRIIKDRLRKIGRDSELEKSIQKLSKQFDVSIANINTLAKNLLDRKKKLVFLDMLGDASINGISDES